MRTMAVFILLAFMAASLPAQVPVKKDLMKLIDQVPPPPASVRDAYAKTGGSKTTGTIKISADKVFESIDREIKGVEDAFKAQAPDAAAMAPGMSPEMAKKMQDPEMKKNMKKMSKEEKMKMAMEMMSSGNMGQPAVVSDPPAVRAALDEWQKIYATIPAEFKSSEAALPKEARVQMEYEKGHEDIAHKEEAEIAKLPQISSGEMSAPDPAKVKVVRLKAADQHIAFANKRLGVIQTTWAASRERTKNRFGVFYQKLIAANYALDSKNPSSKKILADAQLTVLKALAQLNAESRAAYEDSAEWMARRVNIEQQ